MVGLLELVSTLTEHYLLVIGLYLFVCGIKIPLPPETNWEKMVQLNHVVLECFGDDEVEYPIEWLTCLKV